MFTFSVSSPYIWSDVALPSSVWRRQTNPGRGVGERVHGVEKGHEIGDEGRIDGRHEAADIELGKVIRRRLQSS